MGLMDQQKSGPCKLLSSSLCEQGHPSQSDQEDWPILSGIDVLDSQLQSECSKAIELPINNTFQQMLQDPVQTDHAVIMCQNIPSQNISIQADNAKKSQELTSADCAFVNNCDLNTHEKNVKDLLAVPVEVSQCEPGCECLTDMNVCISTDCVSTQLRQSSDFQNNNIKVDVSLQTSRNVHHSFSQHSQDPTKLGPNWSGTSQKKSKLINTNLPDSQSESAKIPSVKRQKSPSLDQVDNASDNHRHEHAFHTGRDTSKFVLYEICGVGVSSIVRRCVEKETGKEYAVKIIDISGEKQEVYQAEQIKQDTLREIYILKMCKGHKHIIELHDSFETPTFIFLVFEICKQGELFDYLTQVVTLSEKRTRFLMRQLLEAVEFLHNKNIVHRDLKPENILLDDNLNVKLSDYGFATVLETGEELTELCGTPGYLAPEVLAVSMYDNVPGYGKEVDMWAFGVIMYTLLCGAPPFWHRKQMQMLRMIMQANYTFKGPEWEDISQTPKDLIKGLLVIDPKQRLTAKQALEHPFFKKEVKPKRKFHAKRAFKAGVICVNFFYRLRYFKIHPLPISGEMVKTNPYMVKNFRKQIDACAFKMYGHWVKKEDNQNRAALFEHSPRNDWKKNNSPDSS